MPNLLSHRYFIDRLIEKRELKPEILAALRLGTQGPDPLFYYGLMPWRGWHYLRALKKYGNNIHRDNGREFLKRFLLVLDDINDHDEREIIEAFCMGQAAHLFLDRAVHPYVYYFSGFDKDGKLTGRFHFQHAHFESNIDSAIMNLNAEYDFYQRTEKIIPDDMKVIKIINKHLTTVVEGLFDAKLGKKYYINSLSNFRSMQKLSSSALLLKISGKHSKFNAMHMPLSPIGDPLNLAKVTWFNPVTKRESDESFLELLEAVICEAKPVFARYFSEGFNPDIIDICDDRSYKGVGVLDKLTYWKQDFNK